MGVDRIEASRVIRADRHTIFEVLRDPKGQVAIDASGSLMSSDDGPVSAVGDTYVIHMDREAINDMPLGLYDVTVEITRFEPDREIAWTVVGMMDPPIAHVYGYRLEDADEPEGASTVTSYCDFSAVPDVYREALSFPVIRSPRCATPSASSPGPSRPSGPGARGRDATRDPRRGPSTASVERTTGFEPATLTLAR